MDDQYDEFGNYIGGREDDSVSGSDASQHQGAKDGSDSDEPVCLLFCIILHVENSNVCHS